MKLGTPFPQYSLNLLQNHVNVFHLAWICLYAIPCET